MVNSRCKKRIMLVMKADIFQRSGGKTLAFDDVAKGDMCQDNVSDEG